MTFLAALLGGSLCLGLAIGQAPADSTTQEPGARKPQDNTKTKGSAEVAAKKQATKPRKKSLQELRWITFDTVLGIVGEKVITLSEVRPEIDAEIMKRQEKARSRDPDAKMSPMDKLRLTQAMAWGLAQRQASKLQMLGNIKKLPVPEERVQQVIDDNVRRRIKKDQDEAGSARALYENLKVQGKTFKEYQAQVRDEITLQIIRSQTFTKYLDGGNLKVTPAEMWDYYRAHSKDYKREARAQIELIRLRINEDKDAALATATKIRQELLAGGEPKKVARVHRAVHHTQPIRPDSGHVAILTDFAFSTRNRVGAWSEPSIDEDYVYVIHLVSRQLGGLKGFKEVDVQRDVRSKILRSRLIELERRLQTSQAQNLSIWPPTLLTSQQPNWPK